MYCSYSFLLPPFPPMSSPSLSHAGSKAIFLKQPPAMAQEHLGSSSLFPFPTPDFGNTWVGLWVFTAFISSSVAESLILGNEGGAGVAWAAMSAFGLMNIAKTCVGAASTGWLRTVIGARSENTDVAVGLEVSSGQRGRGAMRVRRSYSERGPSGLSVDALFLNTRGKPTNLEHKTKWEEIYAFDMLITRGLVGLPIDKPQPVVKNTLPDFQAHVARRNIKKRSEDVDMAPDVYLYSVNPFYPPHDSWFQIPVLLLSLAKVGEGLVLWLLAGNIGIVTVIPWAYFFLVACIVETQEMIVARRPPVLDGKVDIIIGRFPSLIQHTESPQRSWVIIGAPRNPRKTIWWKAAWALGAVICTFVTGLTYLSLAQQTNEIVMLWLMFQALWLVGRMLVHHYAESPREAMAPRLLYKRSWETLSDTSRDRVVNLLVALSKYTTSVHPRLEDAYQDNVSTASELRRIIIETPTILNYPLSLQKELLQPSNHNNIQVDIEIHAVIGDPTLVSAVWLANVPGLTFENMYDTCILCLKLPSGNACRYATIPSVRFLSGVSVSEPPSFNEETSQPLDTLPQFLPKGQLRDTRSTWWYLIPAGKRRWLIVKHAVESPVLGKHSAELVSDERVTAILSRGHLLVSIAHVNDVKSALRNSRKARETLTGILS
ncbi:uncharacterized protein LACBIDRAFT_332786 [Laccaria bicolor S238N-H82]|uniref:Predicted protein n=1 Tax=Laccaria bicolor (strain S238N-H82 / ATCC MYA-4686) TaxID=486041 RepID=B0DTP9_LACBS|nr:uncharacterized protein LACBIDRAFT_332786 [Laccaria bicolor S238N-H82]EDR02016.1 predicted protein [Laccaria bicolor S238N-H82]|eukprot:XP_001887407.1 predicted protein [Laccaria bicolor S238N-H82]